MGRVFFTAKAEAAKAEPAINWSEIESRLQEISAPARVDVPKGTSLPLEKSLPLEAFLPVEASATLAHDPAFFDESPVATDQPVSIPGDPLEMLSMLAAISSNRS